MCSVSSKCLILLSCISDFGYPSKNMFQINHAKFKSKYLPLMAFFMQLVEFCCDIDKLAILIYMYYGRQKIGKQV